MYNLTLKKKVISFFSNDTSILDVKKELDKTQKTENSKVISTGIIILIIMLGIVLIGLISFFYYKKKNLNLKKKFLKYSKFGDDESVHGLADESQLY